MSKGWCPHNMAVCVSNLFNTRVSSPLRDTWAVCQLLSSLLNVPICSANCYSEKHYRSISCARRHTPHLFAPKSTNFPILEQRTRMIDDQAPGRVSGFNGFSLTRVIFSTDNKIKSLQERPGCETFLNKLQTVFNIQQIKLNIIEYNVKI